MIADKSGAISATVAQKVQSPTLLLAGADSPSIFHRIVEVLTATIPVSQRMTIEHATHFLTLTHATDVNRSIEEFWAACSTD
jgi:pimeloyl-ACP methyl ester carboxylesterase